MGWAETKDGFDPHKSSPLGLKAFLVDQHRRLARLQLTALKLSLLSTLGLRGGRSKGRRRIALSVAPSFPWYGNYIY